MKNKAHIEIILPIYNVDGHERVSPYNRPNQDGPRSGMGFRTTADGHDLNRDFLKISTEEARALISLIAFISFGPLRTLFTIFSTSTEN